MTATPSAGHVFDHWEGPVDGAANPVTVTVDWPDLTEQTVTAIFKPSGMRYVLNVSEGNGMVAVDPSPPPDGYPINSPVSLTAYPQSGYIFSHWTGALSGVANPSSLLMDGDKAVAAVFNPTVNVSIRPLDAGTVSLDPPQSPHGYREGTTVAVTAVANDGQRFDHWSGDLSGSQNPIAVQLDSPKAIAANFVRATPFPWWWIPIGLALFACISVAGFLGYVVFSRRPTDY